MAASPPPIAMASMRMAATSRIRPVRDRCGCASRQAASPTARRSCDGASRRGRPCRAAASVRKSSSIWRQRTHSARCNSSSTRSSDVRSKSSAVAARRAARVWSAIVAPPWSQSIPQLGPGTKQEAARRQLRSAEQLGDLLAAVSVGR